MLFRSQHIHNILVERRKKESEIEGKREIGVDGGQQRPDQKGLGLEWRPKKKKNWPPSSDRITVVKELERDGLRERDG